MSEIFLESPVYLGLVAAAAILVALGYWNVSRSKTAGRVLLAVCTLIVAAFILQSIVKTNRERLIETITQLADASERGEIRRIVELVHPQAQFGGQGSRDAFEQKLNSLLEKYDVQNPKVYGFELTFSEDVAMVTCRAACTIVTSQFNRRVPSRWELEFELVDNQWMLTNLRPIEIAMQKFGSFWRIP